MKFLRVVVAVVLTLALLYVTNRTSVGRPEHFRHSENGYTFEITTVPKAYENQLVRLRVGIKGPVGPNLKPTFRFNRFGQDQTTPLYQYDNSPLQVEDTAAGLYYAEVKAGERGGHYWYYFELRDNTGGLRASFTRPDGKPFELTYVGHVPIWILVCHLFFIFATVFFVTKGAFHGIDAMRGREGARPVSVAYGWATLCTFMGTYPFGTAMNWFTFGTLWEGIPFGTDATDNKTQLLFVYLLFVVIASIATLTRGRRGRDAFSSKGLGLLGVLGFFIMLGIFLIPHSIQFAPGLTEAVCWSWIGLVVLVYLIGLIRAFQRPHLNIAPAGKKRR